MKFTPIATTVLVYMFLLELGSLAAFTAWGSQHNVLSAIGIPVLVLTLWSLFLAPKASVPVLPYQIRSVLKFVVFALASAALYDYGQSVLAAIVLVTSLIDVAMVMIMRLDIELPKNGHRI
jgi:hypothetical protein